MQSFSVYYYNGDDSLEDASDDFDTYKAALDEAKAEVIGGYAYAEIVERITVAKVTPHKRTTVKFTIEKVS